ncbi:hypothetical protein [Thiolapillus brandeum]|uniref:hypothetical protein n=1 Tax=Thiolapillus brandeum TaxID=1076588 RepID=UPI000596DEC4|nr:hypothetical protein [Thiolapillus brandeum]
MNKSVYGLIFVGLMAQGGAVWGSAEDDAYYAAMEQMATETDIVQPVAWSGDSMDEVDMEARMKELRKVSPSAWVTYKKLRPAYQAEVRKALRSNQDIYVVIEMIFDRNI